VSRLLALAISALVAGCVHDQQFRTDNPGAPDDPRAVLESAAAYQLGFVEFDDQGWFWDPRQMETVIKTIRSATPALKAGGRKGAVVVLFVHGWKNNAAYDNGNVQTFRSILANLSAFETAESAQEGRDPRKVIGVYAGWRGLSATIEPFKELSFYERKDTAHKVGHGALTELLVRLESLQRSNNASLNGARVQADTRGRETEFVIIGHSFGGAAVHSAISQILLRNFFESVDRGYPLKSFGDLVILLNPAFEASQHEELNDLATHATYARSQEPVLAVFTSKTDWATKYAFPVGRSLSTALESYRTDRPQRAEDLQTIGNFPSFITHDLVYAPGAKAAAAQAAGAAPAQAPVIGRAEASDTVGKILFVRRSWQGREANIHPAANQKAAPPATFTNVVLRPKATYTSGDPFLIVSVDKEIMNGHDDIANPNLIRFLSEFIVFCRPERPQRPSAAAQAAPVRLAAPAP